ncbi:hypothetical protein H6P81_011571 [Aristolochia fimbriata]|uniref:Trafficking protein particle complex subunit 12 n=1 Tax=Aristolochia fimbriata TaxID=158543 RepID=A0AAV7EVE9_ARIFI|nr:hypothetical protein H6P81_011571 [Aristolochia fimbriata]
MDLLPEASPTDPLSSGVPPPHEIHILQDLAARGSWRALVDKVALNRGLGVLSQPHEHLVYLAFNLLALVKLRRYADAAAELASLDALDSDAYRYESHPQHYGALSGSMVPFALRFLQAYLPQYLNDRADAVDRLYSLLDFVRGKFGRKGDDPEKGSGNESVWRKRELFLINTLIAVHLANKDFGVCLHLISDLLRRDPEDPDLVSKLGLIQLQIGDIDSARKTFARVEDVVKDSGDVKLRNLVNRNKALIYLVGKDYVSAVREYEECLERDDTDVVAVNNKGLCLMYLRDLSDAIKVLESSLERAPTVALNETLVVNLCSMYELAYVNHSDVKKTLSNWIAQVAPDDFDSSCTRS